MFCEVLAALQILNSSELLSSFYSLNLSSWHTPPLLTQHTCLPYCLFVLKSCFQTTVYPIAFFVFILLLPVSFCSATPSPMVDFTPKMYQMWFFSLAATLGINSRCAGSRTWLKISSSRPAFEVSLNPRLFHSSTAQGHKVLRAEKLNFSHC